MTFTNMEDSLDQFSAAKDFFSEVANSDGSHPLTHYLYGVVLSRTDGFVEEAISELEKFLSIDAGNSFERQAKAKELIEVLKSL